MQSVDNSRSSGEYWEHALIIHYLRIGSKYALIKKYVLNKPVRLLTVTYDNNGQRNLFH